MGRATFQNLPATEDLRRPGAAHPHAVPKPPARALSAPSDLKWTVRRGGGAGRGGARRGAGRSSVDGGAGGGDAYRQGQESAQLRYVQGRGGLGAARSPTIAVNCTIASVAGSTSTDSAWVPSSSPSRPVKSGMSCGRRFGRRAGCGCAGKSSGSPGSGGAGTPCAVPPLCRSVEEDPLLEPRELPLRGRTARRASPGTSSRPPGPRASVPPGGAPASAAGAGVCGSGSPRRARQARRSGSRGGRAPARRPRGTARSASRAFDVRTGDVGQGLAPTQRERRPAQLGDPSRGTRRMRRSWSGALAELESAGTPAYLAGNTSPGETAPLKSTPVNGITATSEISPPTGR